MDHWISANTPNPAKYPKQMVLVVASDGYSYLVPFVEAHDHVLLDTFDKGAMKTIAATPPTSRKVATAGRVKRRAS